MLRKISFLAANICMALVTLVGLVSACSSPAPAPKPAPSPAAPAPTSTPAPTPAPTPKPAAQTAADFYAKNRVTIIVPSKPGGGTDFAARIFGAYWPEIVPGGSLIVQNMPGGANLLGCNFAYNNAAPDGLTLVLTELASDMIANTLAKEPAVQFDVKKINYMGLFAIHADGFGIGKHITANTLPEMKGISGFRFAVSAPNEVNAVVSAMIAEIFEFKNTQIISGYNGSAEYGLAIGRKEADGVVQDLAVLTDYAAKGLIKPDFPMVMSLKRTALVPNVPTLPELVQLTPKQTEWVTVLSSLGYSGKAIWTRPGVPDDRVQFLRDAFDKMMANDAFVSQMKLRWPIWEKPVPGKDVAATVANAMNIPQATIDELYGLVAKHKGR